ncbi:MAG: DUF4012 domain-containing protein [Patescibacteria group bacterium]
MVKRRKEKKSEYKPAQLLPIIVEENNIISEKIRPIKINIWKRAATFAIVLIILILPIKAFTYYKSLEINKLQGQVMGASEEAMSNFLLASEAVSEMDFNKAENSFTAAGDNFLKAETQLEEINGIIFTIASVIPQANMQLAAESKKIIAAGQTAADLGESLSIALGSIFNNPNKNILEIINSFTAEGNIAIAEAKKLNNELNEINLEAIPSQYSQQFLDLKDKMNVFEKGLEEFVNIADKLKIFLGVNEDKRYLLVFQNNTELRATGGFIGSYALVDISQGKIENIEAPGGGSYDTEGGLRVLVAAPEPLQLVNPLWHFWDANWWPDWPTSAKKLMWFYEKSDGPTVDGVISFTPTFLERLLEIIGPVDMTEEYGVILTAENFWLTTQEIVEDKGDPSQIENNKPKKIIGDLMNKIIFDLPKHLNKNTMIELLKTTEESLSEKHILFYFTDLATQEEISKHGWSGEIYNTRWDYLSVINTNIAGGKTDKRIEEEINHLAEVMADGSIINTVKIKRTHTGIKNEPFAGVRNVDWLRVYVPKGSELIEAHGFLKPNDIYFEDPDESWQKDELIIKEEEGSQVHEASGTRVYEENEKTVFANWSMVDPGETTTIYLKYKLPFKLEKKAVDDRLFIQIKELIIGEQKELYPYALLVQKQAGAKPSKFISRFSLPAEFINIWQYGGGMVKQNNGWQIDDELNIDKYWATVMEVASEN